MFEWNIYLITIAGFGGLFFAVAVGALWWSAKSGQLRNFDQGARVVFTEEEPEGIQTDYFPGQSEKSVRDLRDYNK